MDHPARSLAALKERHAAEGHTPEGALKLWLEACFAYMEPVTRDEGRAMIQYLSLPLRDDPEWDRRPTNTTFASRLADPAFAHVFRSYARGATPDNAYALDPAAWEPDVVDAQDGGPRGLRVRLRSGGADSPRPVTLKRSTKTGLYYVDHWGNLYVGVRPPVDPDAEQFV